MRTTVITLGTAAVLASGLSLGAYAMSHEGKSAARDAFNAALDKCEMMQKDQREDCMNEAMEQYRMAREKEQMQK